MNSPKISIVRGEIVSISELEKTPITLITVQDIDGETETFGCSNKYWKAVGRFFSPGSIVKATVEHRIENTTEYMGADKKVAKHTSSGLNLASITAFSPSAWNREISAATKQTESQMIVAADADTRNALATYLGMAFGK